MFINRNAVTLSAMFIATVDPETDKEVLNALIRYRAKLVKQANIDTERLREDLEDDIDYISHYMKLSEPCTLPINPFGNGLAFHAALRQHHEYLQGIQANSMHLWLHLFFYEQHLSTLPSVN